MECCKPTIITYKFNFSMINLGCNKNLVDSQYLLWKLLSFTKYNKFYKINYFSDPFDKQVEYVFVNSCWFLSTWRQETYETIKQLIDNNKKVYLLWCALSYFENIDKQTAEYKKFKKLLSNKNIFQIGWQDFEKISILSIIKGFNSNKNNYIFPNLPRAYTNAVYKYEYIKIAEWCNNRCTFCIIPKIRWKQQSLPIENIISEIKNMLIAEIEEIILLSQDITRYGIDIYNKYMLFDLLKQIEKIKANFHYRLMYMYPDILSIQKLKQVKSLNKFLPYFDIPLQHISSKILKLMWRFYDEKWIYNLLYFIDKNWKEKFIRTNFIIGFPQETEQDIKNLINFIKQSPLDNIALFEYHDEYFAPSYKLDWKLSDIEIHNRFLEVKKAVDQKLEQNHKKRIWKTYTWYIMDIADKKIVVRPVLHAPEIDEYDTIKADQIINSSKKENIEIWHKITCLL